MAYEETFIDGTIVPLPKIPANRHDELAKLSNGSGHVIDYLRHSVVMNKKRRLAFYSASNILGTQWKKIERTGDFKKDINAIAASHQLGEELYDNIQATSARPNDFEQGHLTSFQEVLWGKTDKERKKAAADTFFYTNCVPQHERVNSGLWRSLEQYILKTETVQHGLKVSVITGPLLSDKDPFYIEKVDGSFIQIPCVFWKVIYYPNNHGLNAVGFMMSHKNLIIDEGTATFDKGAVRTAALRREAEDFFNDYKHDSVYQVKVEFIQRETGLEFMLDNVRLPFQQETKRDVLYKRIEVARALRNMRAPMKTGALDFQLQNIIL
jgi:endonuclease G